MPGFGWKAHPGIWFTLYSLESIFLLGILFSRLDWPVIVENSIIFAWLSFMYWGVVYYHARWIERRMNKS